jgi:ABC-2 type transport system permease protein
MKLSGLIKLQLKNNFSLKRFFGFDIKKNKTKAILIFIAILYALVALLGTFGYMFFDLGKMLNEMNQVHLLLSFAAIYGLGFTMFTVLLRTSGYLFYYKDYEILAPLPIHSRKLFISKLLVLLIMIYFVNFMITLPMMFSYFYWNGFNFFGLLIYLLGIILLPLLPFMFVSMLSLGISLLTSKMRYSKIINMILMIGLLVGFLFLSFSMNNTTVNPLTGQIDLFSDITKYYLPFKWFNQAVDELSILSLVYILGSHVGLFLVYVYFVEKLAAFTNKRGIRSQIKYKQKTLKYQEKPVVVSLVEKEVKRFFSSTLYALNSGIGMVLLVIMSVASLFFKADIESILSQEIGFSVASEMMILIVFGFSIGMTYTPAISLSLEGKQLWILKSLPIKPSTVMLSKILFNLILIVPIAYVSLVMIGIALSIKLVSILIILLLILVFAILVSCMDAVINLYLPKFDYNNETEVIKQSAGAFLGIFGTFAVLITLGFLYYFMSDYVSIEINMLIMTAVAGLLCIPFIWIIKEKSEKIFLNF